MNRIKLGLLLLAALLLSACDIIISGPSVPPSVNVFNASYSTNYEATINGVTQDIICDNRRTELNYTFDYSGNLDSWSSFLRGVESGEIDGLESFTEADIARYGEVDVTYEIPPGEAPLKEESERLNPQRIVVVPNPQVVGRTMLYVTVNGGSNRIPLSSDRSIPVVNPCP